MPSRALRLDLAGIFHGGGLWRLAQELYRVNDQQGNNCRYPNAAKNIQLVLGSQASA
jgi:hypothetical protein